MAVDLAVVGVALDTSQVERGGETVARTFASIGEKAEVMAGRLQRAQAATDAAAQSQQRVTAAAESEQRVLSNLEVAQARLARYRTLTTEQLRAELAAIQQLPPAIRQEEQEITKLVVQLEEERRARRRQVEAQDLLYASQQRQVESAAAAAAATARVGASATSSTAGIGRMRESMTSLAIAASGLPGPIGRVASAAGNLAVGSAVTIGIVGGIALIGAAYRSLTEDARKAREETDKLIESQARQARERLGLQGPADLAAVNQRIQDDQSRLDILRAGSVRGYGNTSVRVVDTEAVAQAEKDLNDARLAQGQLLYELSTRQRDAEQERIRLLKQFESEAERAANEAQRRAEERKRQVEDLARTEANAVTANAKLARDAAAEEQALQAAARLELEQRLRTMDRLSETEKERFRRAGEAVIAAEAQARADKAAEEQAREAAKTERERLQAANERAQQVAKLKQAEAALATSRAVAGGDPLQLEAALRAEASEKIAEQVRSMDQLSEAEKQRLILALEQLDVQDRLNKKAKEAADEAERAAERQQRQQQRAFSAVVGFAGREASDNPFGGAFTGAAQGIGGGTFGVILGGVTGFVNGLLGASTSAEEAARRMKAAREAWARNIEAFVTAAAGGATDLEAAVASAKQQAEDLRKQAKGNYGPFTGLPGYQEKIDQINAAEKEYLDRLAEEAKLKAGQLGEDLQVRALRAQGQNEEADALQLRLTHEREWLGYQKALGDQFDENLQAQLKYVQGLEDELAKKEKAAEIAKYNARTTEDLNVRLLRAQGDDTGADELQRQLDHQREIEEALANGASEATIELIKQVQAQEDLADAQAKASKAAQDLIDSINREARATEDLTVRHLRATGADYAADEAAQRYSQARERQAAIDQGFSQEYLAYLDQVQAEERAYADQQRQQRQQEAFDQAIAQSAGSTFLSDSRTSVNLAVGVSESTAGQMTGLMRSQLSYLAVLPGMKDDTDRMVALLRVIAQAVGGAGLLAVVDQGLGLLQSDADAAAGIPAGNR